VSRDLDDPDIFCGRCVDAGQTVQRVIRPNSISLNPNSFAFRRPDSINMYSASVARPPAMPSAPAAFSVVRSGLAVLVARRLARGSSMTPKPQAPLGLVNQPTTSTSVPIVAMRSSATWPGAPTSLLRALPPNRNAARRAVPEGHSRRFSKRGPASRPGRPYRNFFQEPRRVRG
jgi:hypothetical protein